MSSKEENILKAMELAIEFIRKLDENQLKKLVDKEIEFNLKNKESNNEEIKETVNDNRKSNENVKPGEKNNKFKEIVDNIRGFSTREEAVNYLNSFKKTKLTKDTLIFIGNQFGIIMSKNKTKRDEMIKIIVEETVGNKLKVESIRKAIMGKEKETK